MDRLCVRPGCDRDAVARLSYDRIGCQVWLDPLPARPGPAQEICELHAERLTVPRGWILCDRRADAPALFVAGRSDRRSVGAADEAVEPVVGAATRDRTAGRAATPTTGRGSPRPGVVAPRETRRRPEVRTAEARTAAARTAAARAAQRPAGHPSAGPSPLRGGPAGPPQLFDPPVPPDDGPSGPGALDGTANGIAEGEVNGVAVESPPANGATVDQAAAHEREAPRVLDGPELQASDERVGRTARRRVAETVPVELPGLTAPRAVTDGPDATNGSVVDTAATVGDAERTERTEPDTVDADADTEPGTAARRDAAAEGPPPAEEAADADGPAGVDEDDPDGSLQPTSPLLSRAFRATGPQRSVLTRTLLNEPD